MPESVTDRCTKSHEYIFLFSKSKSYYYDNEAIKENAVYPTGTRRDQKQGDFNGKYSKVDIHRSDSFRAIRDKVNKRSVWTVSKAVYKEAHFATFPPELVKPCLLAGSSEGGVVLDPFMGSGTVAELALKYGRHFVGVEINPEFINIAEKRIAPARAQLQLFLV